MSDQRPELLDELARGGVKHTPESVVGIERTPDGRIVFLEMGNSRAGLQHIVERHAGDLAGRGIPEAQIPDDVMAAVTRGKRVGVQGTRPIFEVEFGGTTQYISIDVGSNGYIVGANPTPSKLIPEPSGGE